jgi:hypothetical protein
MVPVVNFFWGGGGHKSKAALIWMFIGFRVNVDDVLCQNVKTDQ